MPVWALQDAGSSSVRILIHWPMCCLSTCTFVWLVETGNLLYSSIEAYSVLQIRPFPNKATYSKILICFIFLNSLATKPTVPPKRNKNRFMASNLKLRLTMRSLMPLREYKWVPYNASTFPVMWIFSVKNFWRKVMKILDCF